MGLYHEYQISSVVYGPNYLKITLNIKLKKLLQVAGTLADNAVADRLSKKVSIWLNI